MSNKFVKILTICSLIILIPAIVVATAICLTASIAYKVSVDKVILSEAIHSPEANVTVKINGEECNSLYVKKDQEVVITFEIKDYEFEGLFEGTKNTYIGSKKLELNSENAYRFVVSEDTNLTAVFDASQFYKISLNYQADVAPNTDLQRTIDLTATGESVYLDPEEDGVYWAKANENVTISADSVGYNFDAWTYETVGRKEENSFEILANENASYTANFSVIKFNLTYDNGTSSTVNDVVYGTPLQDLEDVYDQGWEAFLGWEFNERIYTSATFDGNVTDITLTPAYKYQKEITYTFNIEESEYAEAGTVTYNTATGLDLSEAPTRDFYNLVALIINGNRFDFDIENNGFADAQNSIDRYLVDSDANTFNVTPVWEMDFDSITFTQNVGSNIDFGSGLTEMEIVKDDGINLEMKLLDYLENTENVEHILISFGGKEYKIYGVDNCKGATILEILSWFKVDPVDNTNPSFIIGLY